MGGFIYFFALSFHGVLRISINKLRDTIHVHLTSGGGSFKCCSKTEVSRLFGSIPMFLGGVKAPLPIDQASLPVDEVNFSPDPPFQSRSFLLLISLGF